MNEKLNLVCRVTLPPPTRFRGLNGNNFTCTSRIYREQQEHVDTATSINSKTVSQRKVMRPDTTVPLFSGALVCLRPTVDIRETPK
jgi:hypothetical protein